MPNFKTSETHPLRIDEVAADGCGGVIGLTFCPGKVQPDAMSGPWARNLHKDLQTIRDWGASALVNLLEVHEMQELRVPHLREAVGNFMAYFHLPIRDTDIPGPEFEQAWKSAGAELRRRLLAGEKILIHCKGGLGRTGMIAARLLVELGLAPDEAIRRVRRARPGTIERERPRRITSANSKPFAETSNSLFMNQSGQ
jgi:ADP-ribosyl-[dinitrogen reductase] hydrolase